MQSHLWLFQLALSGVMTGVIWIIQCVHYPSFRYVEMSQAADFHAHHTSSIGPIVAPLMIGELGLSIYLAYRGGVQSWVILALVLIIWLSTFALQVPLHNSLGKDWSMLSIDKLVNTNWIRTIAWTLKLILVGWVIFNFC